jgi:hypothetical protein
MPVPHAGAEQPGFERRSTGLHAGSGAGVTGQALQPHGPPLPWQARVPIQPPQPHGPHGGSGSRNLQAALAQVRGARVSKTQRVMSSAPLCLMSVRGACTTFVETAAARAVADTARVRDRCSSARAFAVGIGCTGRSPTR